MRHPILLSTTMLACAIGAIQAADTDVQLHGFVSQGFLQTVGANYLSNTKNDGGTFEFTEIGLNATAKPYDRVTLGIQLAANDFGRFFNFEPQVDWAYGRYDLPNRINGIDANVVLGRMKLGHGLYNDFRDLDMTRASVFLPQSNYAPAFRDLFLAGNGVQMNVSAQAGALGSFDLSLFAGGTNLDTKNSILVDTFTNIYRDLPGIGISDVGVTDMKIQRTYAGNLTWNTPLEGLRLKGSAMYSENFRVRGTISPKNAIVVDIDGPGPAPPLPLFPGTYYHETLIPGYVQLIGSAEYQTGDWTFAAEFTHDYFKAIGSITDGNGALVAPANTSYTQFDSGYLAATWQFHPSLQAYVCINATNYGDTEHYNPDNMHRGYNAALCWSVTDHFLLKGEFERNEGSFLLLSKDNPQDSERWWSLFALKGTLDF